LISSCFSTTLLWALGDERNAPATGVAPMTPLATQVGVTLGIGGALHVTRMMATNLPDVFAAGDWTVTQHLLFPPPTYLPLGTTARKQGWVTGENAVGGQRLLLAVWGAPAVESRGSPQITTALRMSVPNDLFRFSGI